MTDAAMTNGAPATTAPATTAEGTRTPPSAPARTPEPEYRPRLLTKSFAERMNISNQIVDHGLPVPPPGLRQTIYAERDILQLTKLCWYFDAVNPTCNLIDRYGYFEATKGEYIIINLRFLRVTENIEDIVCKFILSQKNTINNTDDLHYLRIYDLPSIPGANRFNSGLGKRAENNNRARAFDKAFGDDFLGSSTSRHHPYASSNSGRGRGRGQRRNEQYNNQQQSQSSGATPHFQNLGLN